MWLNMTIMTYQYSSSENTISSILIYILETFYEFYSTLYNIGQLVADAKNSILNRFHIDLGFKLLSYFL